MTITKLSHDFTPIHEGVLFGINTDSTTPTDITVEIIDSDTNKVVATQLLRNTTDTVVNIAPYVERFDRRTPSQQHHTTFAELPTASYHIRIGNMVSESILLSVNLTDVTPPSTLCTMPSRRSISLCERDEVMIFANSGSTLTAEITTNTNEELSLDYTTTTGAASLSISTEDFEDDVKSINIKLLCNGVLLNSLHYDIVPQHKGSTRLAWISESGSIERYTFPVITGINRNAERRYIEGIESRRIIRCSSEEIISLCSHYEPHTTIEALAYIISAPKVWIESRAGCNEVVLRTSSLDYNLFGVPDAVLLEVSVLKREEVVC